MIKAFKYITVVFGVAAMALTSCSKNLESGNGRNEGELVECALLVEFDATKVALNSDERTPNWESDDKILVLDVNKKPVGADGLFSLIDGAGTVSGKFTGKVNAGQIPRYAIYPASAATVSGSSPVTGGLLSNTAGVKADTFKSAVMLGISFNGVNFSFSNACAVLKFNTGDYGKSGDAPAIKSVKISASYGTTATPVAGAFDIDWENLSISAASLGTENELTVELPSALQANDKDIYIPIFPLAKNGSGVAPSMKFEFTNTNDLSAVVSYNFSAAIAGGTLKNLGTARGLKFKLPKPGPDEIWYTTSDGQPITLYEDSDGTTEERFGVKLVSNTYSNGKGVLKFENDIVRINPYPKSPDQSPFYNNSNLTSVTFPESSSITFGYAAFTTNCSYTIYLPDIFTRDSFKAAPFYFFEGQSGKEVTVITSKGSSVIKGGMGLGGQYMLLGDGTKMYIETGGCFSKGTLITLADGSRRPVEEIKFGDKLKVWNFDEGHEDVAEILWMIKGERTFPYYFKCTFSDGTTLNVVGQEGAGNHRLFDKTKGSFKHAHTIEQGDEIYTEHGLVTMVEFEKIEEPIEYYNIVTDKHINCFANEVLTSARYNNRWPIDQDMKFVKDGRKIRPYREFRKAGISRQWYDGMRLGEQQDSIARVKAYIDRAECNGELTPYWEEPGFFARIWNWIKGLFA